MGFDASFDMAEVGKAAQPEIRKVAESINRTAARRMRFTRHQDPSRWSVEPLPDGRVRAGLDSSTGHLDEWGGARSRPSGGLRAAAAEHGTFTPYPKP